MKERHFFGTLEELEVGRFCIREIGKRSIGVTLHQGQPIAILNYCPHAGSPMCRGPIVPKLQINKDNTLGHDEENPVVRCPWHGWEFDLKTGIAVIPSRLKLAHFAVEVENNQIYILV